MMRGKKLLAGVLAFLLVFAGVIGIGMETQAATSKQKALKAYKSMLSEKTMRWGNDTYYTAIPTENCEFALAYIDNDPVPELIVSNRRDITHIAGFGVVYTYNKGKVQVVGNIQLDGDFSYYHKKGVFVTDYMMSGISRSYNKLKDGKITQKLSQRIIYNTNGQEEISYYNGNGKQISTKKFNKNLKKLVGSRKKTTVKFYKNTLDARKKYLK